MCICHAVAQHLVHQTCQLGRHGLDGDAWAPSGPEPAELRSQIRQACLQGTAGNFEGLSETILGGGFPLADDLVAADAVVRRQPQPGNKMVCDWPWVI